MKVLTIILVAFVIRKVYTAICPDTLGSKCKNSGDCTRLEECYRDLDGTPNKTAHYCCRMRCPHTDLQTFHSHNDNGYLHKMTQRLKEKLQDLYYEEGTLKIACPYPYSHAIINMDKVLPEGFSTNSKTQLKTCTTNGDCGEGFFCGYSVNPSFDNYGNAVTRLDESDGGDAMRFCYRNPTLDNKFIVAFNVSGFSLPLCNTDSECLKLDAICYLFGQTELWGKSYKDVGQGICVRALLCDNPEKSDKSIAVLTKNGTYCTNANDCIGVRDEVYLPKCVSFENANTTNGSLCCFTPKMCEYGTARIPKVSCNSSIDCNIGRSGPWSSWCDEKGFCCHDTNGTVQHLCPDGATLIFNEPKCADTCKNGICVNGRCCPGLKIENDKVTLGTSPYITRMPCNPNEPLPAHFRFAYCSYQEVVVVLGANNAFGEKFTLSDEKKCEKNEDCEQSEENTVSKEEYPSKEDIGRKEEAALPEETDSQKEAILKEKDVSKKAICIRGNVSSLCDISPFKKPFIEERLTAPSFPWEIYTICGFVIFALLAVVIIYFSYKFINKQNRIEKRKEKEARLESMEMLAIQERERRKKQYNMIHSKYGYIQELENYRQKIDEGTVDRKNFLKTMVEQGDEVLTKAELYEHLMIAYLGLWKDSPRSEIKVLRNALTDSNNRMNEIGDSATFLETTTWNMMRYQGVQLMYLFKKLYFIVG